MKDEEMAEEYIKSLEAQIEKMKSELTKKADTNHSLVEQMADLEWQLQEVAKDNDYYQAENKRLEEQIEKIKQDLDNARENANKQEQWEIYSVLNDIYNDDFEVITSVSN